MSEAFETQDQAQATCKNAHCVSTSASGLHVGNWPPRQMMSLCVPSMHIVGHVVERMGRLSACFGMHGARYNVHKAVTLAQDAHQKRHKYKNKIWAWPFFFFEAQIVGKWPLISTGMQEHRSMQSKSNQHYNWQYISQLHAQLTLQSLDLLTIRV
jgi:hypothetical protein